MIATLHGKIIEKDSDSVVVEVGGVGMRVYIPTPLLAHLVLHESRFFFTYLAVREDSLTLYGFESRDEREFFALLLGVSGIGPRLGLAALSTLNPDTMRRAVLHEQPEVFSRIPGVGKKTAQRILLHLQDRIEAVGELEPVRMMSDADSEVLEALTSLGYSVVEAQAALQSVSREAPDDVETRLRLALRYFS